MNGGIYVANGSNGLKPISPGTMPLASDVQQLVGALSGANDVGTLTFVSPQPQPPAPSVTNSGSSGNLNGAYIWFTVIVTGWKQTDGSYWVSGFAPSLASSSTNITNQSANVALQTGTTSTIGRLIYRTAAGGLANTAQFVGAVWDNVTTTFADNVADANLGTNLPGASSNPAIYGQPIPTVVMTSNTTGTFIAIPNLAELPDVGPENALCIVNNELYQSNGTTWVSLTTPLSPATGTSLGGVKIGAGINVQADGTISAQQFNPVVSPFV